MNIKEASKATGVSGQNIRFYERQGLLHPARNPDNDYRDYSREDMRDLKIIRALRMLDMPLEQIRGVLRGELSLSAAAKAHQQLLEARSRELQGALQLCGRLAAYTPDVATWDVDGTLRQMDEAPGETGYFTKWRQDYRAVAKAQAQQRFTFIPDDSIETPQQFTDALFAYAKQEKVDIVVTNECMYPTFTMDGVEYMADRAYERTGGYGFSVPVAVVRCEMTHPEIVEPESVSPGRRKLLHGFRAALPTLFVIALTLIIPLRGGAFDHGVTLSGVIGFLSLPVLMGAVGFFGWYMHYNDKH